MIQSRKISLDPIHISGWRWKPFLDILISQLSQFPLEPYPIPINFLDNDVSLGTSNKPLQVKTSTWACSTKKIRQARVACVQAKNVASVFNLVIAPLPEFDLPFLGVDLVTLPTGHLLALDLQPALKYDLQHTGKVWDQLLPIYQKWKDFLPDGGPIPKDADRYFSPGFLWTRIPIGDSGDKLIDDIIKPAFSQYLSLFLDLITNSKKVDEKRSKLILEGQKEYMKYRAQKDPARGMLTRFYGIDWTENYINNVLFDLQ